MSVWQPEIIRGRQRQIVQQSNVPVEFRINALEMEINLCKQQISGFDKALVRTYILFCIILQCKSIDGFAGCFIEFGFRFIAASRKKKASCS